MSLGLHGMDAPLFSGNSLPDAEDSRTTGLESISCTEFAAVVELLSGQAIWRPQAAITNLPPAKTAGDAPTRCWLDGDGPNGCILLYRVCLNRCLGPRHCGPLMLAFSDHRHEDVLNPEEHIFSQMGSAKG
jgi:hypothetical protein